METMKKKLQRFVSLGTSYHLQKIKFIYSSIYDVCSFSTFLINVVKR